MATPHILVAADTADVSDQLIGSLLPKAGYKVTKADEFNAPPACDVILLDVSMLRSASPFATLKAQRRLGCEAPAILFVPRVTEQMATELFPLGIRELVLKPVDDEARMSKLAEFVKRIQTERDQAAVQQNLSKTQADLARRLEEMSTLTRIGRAISSASDIDTMLSHIVEAAVFLTRADEGAVFLVDKSSGGLVLRAEQGMGTQRAAALQQPSKDSDAMAVLQSGKPVLKGGETEHKVKTGYLARALINVPIVVGQAVTGVLAVYSLGLHNFEASDEAVLISLADYAAIALDKGNALAQLKGEIDDAAKAARTVMSHAETLFDPVDGIESQVDTLLSGGFDPLTENQRGAVSRIKSATGRLKEVVGLIRQTMPGDNKSA